MTLAMVSPFSGLESAAGLDNPWILSSGSVAPVPFHSGLQDPVALEHGVRVRGG